MKCPAKTCVVLLGIALNSMAMISAAGEIAAIPASKVERREESTIHGRKVVRYEHDSMPEWQYAKPQRDYFFVAYPSVSREGKAPLRVVLHSAGGSAEKEMPSTLKTHVDGSFYELYLDCKRNAATDWWWGYDSIKRQYDRFRTELCPTERRVLATVAWALENFNIDRDRVYLSGVSMGGSGSLGIGLRRGDLFAAIAVTVPAGAGHGLLRMNVGEHADPPPLFDFSSQNDFWAEGQGDLLACCQSQRYFLAFAWGPLGHINDSSRFNSAVSEFPWMEIRKNAAYPVFTAASSDNCYPGLQNTGKPDGQTGQIGGVFRWKNVTDTPTEFAMELRLVRKRELSKPVDVPEAATADVTLRRLQRFAVESGKTYKWQIIANGKSLQSGAVRANGTLTIPNVRITGSPTTLKIVDRWRLAAGALCNDSPAFSDDTLPRLHPRHFDVPLQFPAEVEEASDGRCCGDCRKDPPHSAESLRAARRAHASVHRLFPHG
ncbi:MAG: hypothetical protein LLG00_07810 [Planctomycetaceae bacterium]|nr:hypothetical protein [Planctomycetaceae bacterium]